MFLRTFLSIASVAAISAAAHAGGPCDTAGGKNCGQPALTAASTAPYMPAVKLAEALTRKEAALGREHPDTLATANALAALYKHIGKYTDAEYLYLNSLAACERTLGRTHALTLGTMKSLAVLYEAQGRQSEAALLLKRATQTDPSQLSY
jgi:tetratricopeptide (TPR) repeat protein